MGTTTVSLTVPVELKRELEAHDVDISETIREALEAEVRRRRRAELSERLETVQSEINDSLSTDEILTAVQSDRDR